MVRKELSRKDLIRRIRTLELRNDSLTRIINIQREFIQDLTGNDLDKDVELGQLLKEMNEDERLVE